MGRVVPDVNRSSRRRHAQRESALDAARSLLAEPGNRLTVEAIARRAGLGVGTVVRAFGGKDALLDAAVSGLLEPVVQRGRTWWHRPPRRGAADFLLS